MILAIALFLAGAIEYAVIAAWYEAYNTGRIARVMLVTHVQIALWLFVIGSIVAIVEKPEVSKWLALSYTEGCALGAGAMCWRSKRAPETDADVAG